MELSSKQYYVHNSFINAYYYIYVALENWVSKNIFREDSSRVFLSSPDYAFRRRFEITDMSKNYEDIEIASLDFPFANYWPLNTGWQPDKRIAATNAALIYKGIYEGNTKIKAIPSYMDIPIIFYFNREDDARIAYEILYFKSFNEHYYTQEMPYAGNTIEIPVNMTIENIEFNPKFEESDWLKNNRIFTIECIFKLRSFSIEPPLQPKYYNSIDANGYDKNGDLYNDGYERNYIVDEVLLRQRDENGNRNSLIKVPQKLNNDGTFEESKILIDQFNIIPIERNKAKLTWIDSSSEENKPVKAVLNFNNYTKSINIDLSKSSYIIDNLDPGSSYIFYLTFYNKKGVSKKLGKEYNQPPTEEQLNSREEPSNSLVGLSW